MNIDFGKALLELLGERGWSQAELAKRTGRSRTAISDVISGKRNPGQALLMDIAEAMNLPPERLFRLAGIFHEKPEPDPLIEEGIHILHRLEGENKEEAIRQLRLRLQVAEERGKYNGRKRKTGSRTAG